MQGSPLSLLVLTVASLILFLHSAFGSFSGTMQSEAGHQRELFKVSKSDDLTF